MKPTDDCNAFRTPAASPDHDHAPGHAGHAGHAHSHDDPLAHATLTDADSRRRVMLAALLTLGFMVVEVTGAVMSGSLALLADAAHMLTDAASLALAWLGYRLAERPADATRSYGFSRVKILAAFTNGVVLVLLAAWILWEAINRLMPPVEVMGDVLLVIAVMGLIVNLVAFAILHGGARDDLNLQGAVWHVLGDLFGSLAAIAAAIIILTTGWMPIDPILSVVVAAIVAVAGVRIARQSGHILLEGTPKGLTTAAVRADLVAHVEGLDAVVHIHIWALTEADPLVTLEAVARAGTNPDTLRRAIKTRLAQQFQLTHATVEIISEAAESH
jgi:cobalt-zinc-cadmium efflux system protein